MKLNIELAFLFIAVAEKTSSANELDTGRMQSCVTKKCNKICLLKNACKSRRDIASANDEISALVDYTVVIGENNTILNENLITVEDDIVSMKTDISDLKLLSSTNISALKEDLARANKEISLLRSIINSTNVDILNLRQDIASNNNNISTFELNLASANTEISTLVVDLASAKAETSAIKESTNVNISALKMKLDILCPTIVDGKCLEAPPTSTPTGMPTFLPTQKTCTIEEMGLVRTTTEMRDDYYVLCDLCGEEAGDYNVRKSHRQYPNGCGRHGDDCMYLGCDVQLGQTTYYYTWNYYVKQFTGSDNSILACLKSTAIASSMCEPPTESPTTAPALNGLLTQKTCTIEEMGLVRTTTEMRDDYYDICDLCGEEAGAYNINKAHRQYPNSCGRHGDDCMYLSCGMSVGNTGYSYTWNWNVKQFKGSDDYVLACLKQTAIASSMCELPIAL